MTEPQYSAMISCWWMGWVAKSPCPEKGRLDCLISSLIISESRMSQNCYRGSLLPCQLCYKSIHLYPLMSSDLCYWQARSLADTVILLCFLALVLAIVLLTAYRLKNTIRLGEQAANIIKIYLLVLLWGTVLTFQFLYGTIVYLTQIHDNYDLDMDQYSRFYLRADIIPGFTVQTIFLFICRLFFKGLTNTIPISTMAAWQRRLMSILSVYCIARIVLEGICILLLNIFAETDNVKTFLDLAIWVLIVDCVITNIFLVTSLKIFQVRFKQNDKLNEQDYGKLRRQYTIMIFTSLLRIVIDLFFLIIIPFTGILDGNSCVGPFEQHSFRTIVYTGVGNIVNHLVPILWVIKIYNISEEQINSSSTEDGERFNLIQSIMKSQD